MNKQKGFTIIELIVVIAIIAVLAAIVMVNVTQYISKGKDAAVKGNLATLMTNGAQYFDNEGDYAGFDTSASWNAVNAGLTGYTLVKGTPNSTAWCASVNLKTGNIFCVDSTGAKRESATATCAAQTCPQ